MKKNLLIALSILFSVTLFAQNPAVSITISNVTETSFTATFAPNADCAKYDYVAMTDDDINMWSMFAGSVDNLITMFGVHATAADTHIWNSDIAPGTTYKVMVRPFDAADNPYPYTYEEVTTLSSGGSGTAEISVTVSDITESTVHIICIPNDQTALYYDGLCTVDYFNSVPLDTVKSIIMENPNNLQYATDDWTWPGLMSNTDYYAIAFGQNSDGVWGPDSIVPFTTLGNGGGDSTGVTNINEPVIVLYPMPCQGSFNIAGKDIAGSSAQLFTIGGQLVGTYNLDSDNTHISTNLPSGNYIIRVLNANGQTMGRKNIVIQ